MPFKIVDTCLSVPIMTRSASCLFSHTTILISWSQVGSAVRTLGPFESEEDVDSIAPVLQSWDATLTFDLFEVHLLTSSPAPTDAKHALNTPPTQHPH